jgi:hypothetical protein
LPGLFRCYALLFADVYFIFAAIYYAEPAHAGRCLPLSPLFFMPPLIRLRLLLFLLIIHTPIDSQLIFQLSGHTPAPFRCQAPR